MEQRLLNGLLIYLRIVAIVLVSTLLGVVVFSFRTAKLADDLWQKLGMSKVTGEEGISNSFLQGYFYSYGARNVKNMAAGDRLAVAQELLAYTKKYVNSEAFIKQYQLSRKNAEPLQPPPAKTKEAIQKQHVDRQDKTIANMEKSLKQMPADMHKAYRESIDMMKKQVEELKDPNSPLLKMYADSEVYAYEAARTRYEQEIKQWQTNFPEDYRQLIKKRLQKMLEKTSGVDFSAALKEQYGKKRFVNPEYEAKPTEWKQAFRAGKDITGAARHFAEVWLNELH